MKSAIYIAKGSLNFSLGVGLSVLFISTMDDVIYGDFKRNIILPLHMVSVKGTTQDVKLLKDGTGKFVSKFKPSAIAPESAKDLLLKDSEYSTPEDHYFAHIQSKK